LQLYVPLKFWFNRHYGLSLPLVALQYHDVRIKLKYRSLFSLLNSDREDEVTPVFSSDPEISLYCNYIYLDTDERKRFAQVPHEYLIEQVQLKSKTLQIKNNINFNHPVKELIWVCQSRHVISSTSNTIKDTNVKLNITDDNTVWTNKNDYLNYNTASTNHSVYMNTDTNYDSFKEAHLEFNGDERFSPLKASYLRTLSNTQSGHKMPKKNIYSYSFSLKPEEHQPSGSCNFSRINNAYLILEEPTNLNIHNMEISIYALNYNILRIMSGMAGLVYSN